MKKKKIKYRASNDEHDISGCIWKPDHEESVRGVVQIAHGMCEHFERYDSVARFLVEKGYIVCANDHAGHGDSVNGTYGYMGSKDGYKHLVHDMHNLYLMMKVEYENIPYYLLGHSMGSFLARYYCKQYGEGIDGILYSGTGIAVKNINIIIFLCNLLVKLKGPKTPGLFFSNISNRAFNKKFRPARTTADWLSRDVKIVNDFITDKRCSFTFPYAGYLDLFKLIKEINSDIWYENIPLDLPVYIFSGTQDPVGEYGKGVKIFYNKLLNAGCTQVSLKLYEDGRHEMLNETNREEVYNDLYKWLETLVKEY